MKKIILTATLFVLLFSAKLQSQNFVVKNPPSYPWGINIDVDYTPKFAREFSISHSTTGNLFSFGVLGDNSKLQYGYIGGNNAFNNNIHANPWMTFLPTGNIGIGTTTPQYKLDVNGSLRASGTATFQSDIILKTGTEDLTLFGTYGKKLYFGNQADNGDYIWMARYNLEANRSDLRINIGDDVKRGGDDRFVVGNIAWNAEGLWKDWFVVNNDGKVGIQVSNPQYPLDVNGAIHAKEVIIDTNFPLADYVFRPDYKLMPLHEVEQFVKTNNHLPEIPSAAQVEKNGMNLGEIQNKLLQKIEELTLYVIEQNKRIQQLEDQLDQSNNPIK